MENHPLASRDIRFHRATTMFNATLSWVGYGCGEDGLFYRKVASDREQQSILIDWPIDEICGREIEAYFADGMAERFDAETLSGEFLTKVLEPLTKRAAGGSIPGFFAQELTLCNFTLRLLDRLEGCFAVAMLLLLGCLARSLREAVQRTVARITAEPSEVGQDPLRQVEPLVSEAIKSYEQWTQTWPNNAVAGDSGAAT
jgi:hypothetical protein